MKKILAILLAVVMLVGTMPIYALQYDVDSDGESFVLKASDATITEDDTTVDVNIDIIENTGVYAMKYYVIYDKELTLVSNDNVTKGTAFADFLTSDVGSKDITCEEMSTLDIDWDWMLENFEYDYGWTLENPDDVLVTTVFSECVNWYDSSTDVGTICTFTFQIAPDNTKEEFTVQIIPVYGNYIRDDPDHPNADDTGIVEIFDPQGLPGIITIEKPEPECEHEYFNECDPVCMICGEITREASHNVQHVAAVAPSCFENGNIEYWFCDVCGAAWSNEALTAVTNLRNVIIPAAHKFAFPCDTYCQICEEDVREPAHELTYVPAVDAIDCQTPGNIEHWYCEVCDGYFNDAEGYNQLNPWYIPVTADCVRPEGAADCATVSCEVCGNEIYGEGEHDVLACKGGTCGKCGDYIEGYGCSNYDTPACMDGVCSYCGGFVAGYGHENGAWAPCCDGECSYGCGLKYPATEEHVDDDGDEYCDNCWNHLNHVFEDGFDPCYGGECSVCWTYVPGEHNLIHVEAKAATCFENGNLEYWFCEVCGYAWLDAECTLNTNVLSVILPMAHGEIKHVDAANSTCFEDGNIEYWFCEDCGYAWLDAECTLNTNLKAVITPAAHAELTHVEAKAATCFENGNLEYWYCEECGFAWLDAEGTLNTNLKAVVLPMAHGNIIHVEAKAATCFENGNLEHWYCEDCGYAWLDEACTLNTNLLAVVLPMAHAELTHVEAKAATCFEDGNIEYWYCEACGYAWLDAEGTLNTNLKAVVLPMAHAELTHVEAKAATCYENGNIEYWTCELCGYAWLDAEGTLNTNLLAVVLPMAHGEIIHVEAKAATCFENGNIEYWYCVACGQAWLDAECTLNTNLKAVVVPGPLVQLVHVEAKAPTCTEEGNIEYWYCPECGYAWLDAEGTLNTNLKAVILPETGHVAGEPAIEDGYLVTRCTACDIVLESTVIPGPVYRPLDIEPGFFADGALCTIDNETATINIVSKMDAETVDFRVLFPVASTDLFYVTTQNADITIKQIVNGELVVVDGTNEDATLWKYFEASVVNGYSQSFELIITDKETGIDYIYTVNVEFAHGPACTGIEPGWSADAALTGFDAENDHVINVVSKAGMDQVDFRMMNMAFGSYAEIYSGDASVIQWVVSENAYVNVTDDMPEAEDNTQWKYFTSFKSEGIEQSYEVIVYFIDGSSEIFTVNVTFVD